MTTKIALAGEGGQGVQSVAEILAEAANAEGREAIYIPNFGVEQRGGVSIAFVQIDDQRIGSPKFKTADIVIALSGRAIPRTAQYVDERTVFIYDSAIEVNDDELPKNAKKILSIPALEVAQNELHPRVFNIIILGAVLEATKVVTLEQAKAAIEEKLGHKFAQKPELRDLNYRAMERGIELVQQAK
nr:2-oxoacid:acceptor oxidoreductase family protein [Desulfuribacillus stibiiarsenatis]